MKFRVWPVAAAAIVSLSLTACSSEADPPGPSPTPSESASASASPTPGTVVGSGTFALTLPKGWAEQVETGGALLLGISNQSFDGYPTNINIVSDPTIVAVASEQLAAHRTEILREAGATNISDRGDFPVDGEPGSRLNYRQAFDGIVVVSNEISVAHEDIGYIITFSYSPTVAAATRNELVNDMMATWTWTP